MKTYLISKLALRLSAALLIGGCIQVEDIFVEERRGSETGLTEPLIHARLSHIDGGCEVASDEGASSEMVIVPVSPVTCSEAVPRGEEIQLAVDVDWREQPFGAIQVSDTCGISFDVSSQEPWYITASFQAPPVDTRCSITLDAVDEGGNVRASATMTFDVREPQPRPDIQASIVFVHQGDECRLTPGQREAECSPMPRGERASLHVEVDWDTAEPGVITLFDCGGEFDLLEETSDVVEAEWMSPLIPGGIPPDGTCTVGVDATSPDGWSYSFELHVPLL